MDVLTQNVITDTNSGITLDIRREDLIHPQISGNKFRKMKYNISHALEQGFKSILTFGGAYSNHIAATAFAGELYNIPTIGVIRGEELASKIESNPTLKLAKELGMKLIFETRADYKLKGSNEYLLRLKEEYPNAYIIPEGGTNELAVKGCEEILKPSDEIYDYVCCSVGTGGTISGLIRSSLQAQSILGFSSLKGSGIQEDISKFVSQKNWRISTDYHFGGYAKINEELIAFINAFHHNYKIPLDPVYTGKMMFGIVDLMSKDYFSKGTKILAIHTGGLQGIKGMNLRLKRLNKPLINE